MKKSLTAILLAAMLLLNAVGCTRRGQTSEPVDETKTQLYVGCFEGGYGRTWLDNYAARFEEMYADEHFEEGKTGVQVHVMQSRDFGTSNILTTMANSESEIFFLEQSDYYQMVNRGLLLDITEAVTTSLTEYGEDESIVGKMYDTDAAFYLTDDNKYYAVPAYEATYGIFYDIDMFEQNNFYFAAEGQGDSDGFVRNADTPRSNGPDGQPGTDDDGLPATYDEFFRLCDRISETSYAITWPGRSSHYVNALMMSLQADYEGPEQMMLNYTMSGRATNLVSSVSDDGTVTTYADDITPATGYKLYKQAGRYYALDFVQRLVAGSDDYYSYNDCFSSSQTHILSQSQFLQSRFSREIRDIAMLIDGTWWFNEASRTFNEMANIPGASREERRIGMMPLPKVDDEHLGPSTYFSVYMTELCIKSNIAESKIPAAEAFLRFCRTNESLSAFTADTNTTVPYDYTLEPEDEARITSYGKQLYDMHCNSVKVTPWAKNRVYLADSASFLAAEDAWISQVGTDSYNIATTAMHRLHGNLTARQYFDGLSVYNSETNWNNRYSAYF